jgi:hypothetical protein
MLPVHFSLSAYLLVLRLIILPTTIRLERQTVYLILQGVKRVLWDCVSKERNTFAKGLFSRIGQIPSKDECHKTFFPRLWRYGSKLDRCQLNCLAKPIVYSRDWVCALSRLHFWKTLLHRLKLDYSILFFRDKRSSLLNLRVDDERKVLWHNWLFWRNYFAHHQNYSPGKDREMR